jgi:hypothetical protein
MFDLIGQLVRNDIVALRERFAVYFTIDHLQHIGNFVFMAELTENCLITITTKPVDDEYETVQVVSVLLSSTMSQNI